MNMKKLAIIVPLTSMISMGAIAPITSFAEEVKAQSTVPQENVIQGYVIKDGMQTPVHKNSNLKAKTSNLAQSGPAAPEFPALPLNPLASVPQTGKSVMESTNVGDRVYFEGAAKFSDGRAGKCFVQKLPSGNIGIGVYDPNTLEIELSDLESVINNPSLPDDVKQAYKNIQDTYNRMYSKIFDGKTKVKRETQYELIDQSTQDNPIPYTFTKTTTSGITKADAFGFAATMGWKIGAKGGIPGVGEISAEFSLNLTASYNHTITVTEQESKSNSYPIGKVDNPSYPYNKYTVAAYQLNSKYTLVPGTGLQEVLSEDKQLGNLKGLAQSIYNYKDSGLYVGVTPGSHVDPK